MIRVAGNWELSWNTPIKEAELWNFVLREFEIPKWFMWPITGIKHNEERAVELVEKKTFQDVLAENEDVARVFVEPADHRDRYVTKDLREFQHPADVVYIFGSAHFNPMFSAKLRENDAAISVPTIQNAGVLWPHQCLLTVLYDRLVKGWL